MYIELERPMRRIVGSAAAPGLAEGPLFRLDAQPRSARSAGTPDEERDALARAMRAAQSELERVSGARSDYDPAWQQVTPLMGPVSSAPAR